MSQHSANRGVIIGLTKLFCKIKCCTQTVINGISNNVEFYILYAVGHLPFTYFLSGVPSRYSTMSKVYTQTFQQNKLRAVCIHAFFIIQILVEGLAPLLKIHSRQHRRKSDVLQLRNSEKVAKSYVDCSIQATSISLLLMSPHWTQFCYKVSILAAAFN